MKNHHGFHFHWHIIDWEAWNTIQKRKRGREVSSIFYSEFRKRSSNLERDHCFAAAAKKIVIILEYKYNI